MRLAPVAAAVRRGRSREPRRGATSPPTPSSDCARPWCPRPRWIWRRPTAATAVEIGARAAFGVRVGASRFAPFAALHAELIPEPAGDLRAAARRGGPHPVPLDRRERGRVDGAPAMTARHAIRCARPSSSSLAALGGGCGPRLDVGSDVLWTGLFEGNNFDEWTGDGAGDALAFPAAAQPDRDLGRARSPRRLRGQADHRRPAGRRARQRGARARGRSAAAGGLLQRLVLPPAQHHASACTGSSSSFASRIRRRWTSSSTWISSTCRPAR